MTQTELIKTLQDSNRRLNRRCQQLESDIANNRLAHKAGIQGFREGHACGVKEAKKDFDKKLADYKFSTRAELKDLREQIEGFKHVIKMLQGR